MSELALSAKEVTLRIDRGMTTAFKVDAPEDFDGTAELRIYAVGSTEPTVITATLDVGDLVFEIDNSVSEVLPSQGRYAVVWTDAEGEPRSIIKGPFFNEALP